MISAAGALVAQLLEIRKRRVALWNWEARKPVALEAKVNGAAGGQLARVADSLHPGRRGSGVGTRIPRGRAACGRQCHQLTGPLQERLSVRAPEVAQLVERSAVADRRQDVVELPALGVGVMDVVRDHDRQAHLFGEERGLRHEPVVVGEQMMLQLEEEAGRGRGIAVAVAAVGSGGPRPGAGRSTAEEPRIPFRGGVRPGPIPDPQPPGDLALAATGKRHQPVRVPGQQLLAEARHGFRAGEVRPTHQAAEAAIAGRVPGQQDEVRAALPLAHAPKILFDRVPMAGEPGAVRAWPGGQAVAPWPFPGEWHRTRQRAAPWPTRRHDDPRRIGRRRVQQLDLDPDDRPQPRLLGRGRKADHAVQAAVVRDRQAGEPQLHGAPDQLVRRRGAVEERELSVAVELGVEGHRRLGWFGRQAIRSAGRVGRFGGKLNNRTNVRVSEEP